MNLVALLVTIAALGAPLLTAALVILMLVVPWPRRSDAPLMGH